MDSKLRLPTTLSRDIESMLCDQRINCKPAHERNPKRSLYQMERLQLQLDADAFWPIARQQSPPKQSQPAPILKSKESVKKDTKKSIKTVLKDIPKRGVREIPKSAVKDFPKEVANNIANNIPKEICKEIPKETLVTVKQENASEWHLIVFRNLGEIHLGLTCRVNQLEWEFTHGLQYGVLDRNVALSEVEVCEGGVWQWSASIGMMSQPSTHSQSNLTCALLYDTLHTPPAKGRFQLSIFLGTHSQINNCLSFLTLVHSQQGNERHAEVVRHVQGSNQSNGSRDGSRNGSRNGSQQVPFRTHTESANVSREGEGSATQPDEDDISLADLLSNFLHAFDLASQSQPIPIEPLLLEDFIAQCNKTMGPDPPQRQLLQIMGSLFGWREGSVDMAQLCQSSAALHQFSNSLQHKRQECLRELLRRETHAISLLQRHSRIGVIGRGLMWSILGVTGTVLSEDLQQAYHIGHEAPFNVEPLIHDLTLVASQQPVPIQMSQATIGDLKRIVRNTVQAYLSSLPPLQLEAIIHFVEAIKLKEQIERESAGVVNLQVMREVMTEAGLRLSLWEALMAIEHLKEWFGCDFHLDEGVLTAETLLLWLSSLFPRHLLKEEPLKNESDILNIANLLRHRDQIEGEGQKVQEQKEVHEIVYVPTDPSILVDGVVDGVVDGAVDGVVDGAVDGVVDEAQSLEEEGLYCTIESIHFNQANQSQGYIRVQLGMEEGIKYLYWKPHNPPISCHLATHPKGLPIALQKPSFTSYGQHDFLLCRGYLPLDPLAPRNTVILYSARVAVGKIVVSLSREGTQTKEESEVWVMVRKMGGQKLKVIKVGGQEAQIGKVQKTTVEQFKVQIGNEEHFVVIGVERLLFEPEFEEEYALADRTSGACAGTVCVHFWRNQPTTEQLKFNIQVPRPPTLERKLVAQIDCLIGKTRTVLEVEKERDPYLRIDRLCKEIQKTYGQS